VISANKFILLYYIGPRNLAVPYATRYLAVPNETRNLAVSHGTRQFSETNEKGASARILFELEINRPGLVAYSSDWRNHEPVWKFVREQQMLSCDPSWLYPSSVYIRLKIRLLFEFAIFFLYFFVFMLCSTISIKGIFIKYHE